jgi:hypothetical protein
MADPLHVVGDLLIVAMDCHLADEKRPRGAPANMRRKGLRRLIARGWLCASLRCDPVAFHPGKIVERCRLLAKVGRWLGSGCETGAGEERRDDSDGRKNAAATKGHGVLDQDSAATGNPPANRRCGHGGKERNEAVW